MKSLGTLLLLFGIASIAFSLLGREVRLLTWINNWGENVAWGIRGGFVVVGLLLMVLGGRGSQDR
ncbi:MAG: hypothetical protein KDC95_07430 [Planctomycetes bacterium]|nr:hypothetical protein [Planctomycetota bacterium]